MEDDMQSSYAQANSTIRMLSMAIAGAMLVASPQVSATIVGATGTVVQIYTYPDFGSGDFVFRLSATVAGCEGGFWLSPSQPGFKASVAFVMQARASGESITVGGNDALIWNGSGSKFCKVDWLAAN
jgi:hypothetical protein